MRYNIRVSKCYRCGPCGTISFTENKLEYSTVSVHSNTTDMVPYKYAMNA